MSRFRCLFVALLSALCLGSCAHLERTGLPVAPPASEWVEQCSDWDEWDKPGPPFRIYGNSYYVGTCGISAILLVGAGSHVLIDGGTEAGARHIADNIRSLGIDLAEVDLLLHSHEHFDHVGGLAELQRLSGAALLASPAAAPVLRSGVSSAGDPQAGMHAPFAAAKVKDTISEGVKLSGGGVELRAIATPGHTPGALSWQWQSCEGDRCLSIVYADSLSPISSKTYRFSEHLPYVRAFRRGLEKLASLDCQILLAPHPSAANMRKRLLSQQGLIDASGCLAYADKVTSQLNTRLQKEQKSE